MKRLVLFFALAVTTSTAFAKDPAMLSPADQQAISASLSSVGNALAMQDFDPIASQHDPGK